MRHVEKRSYLDNRKPGERLSEYFDFTRWPEKATLPVRRQELLAILDRHFKAQEARRWHRRLWAFLRRPWGSGPTRVVPPTKGEIERGEAAPT